MGRLRDKVRAGVSFSTKLSPAIKSQKSEADTQVIREKLKTMSVLGALSLSQIDEMIAYMSVKIISEHQSVSLTNGLHLVLEGTLVQKASGKDSVEKRYTKGDMFGHVELLYGGHNEPMRATTKTKVCYLSREVYQKYTAARGTAKQSRNMRLISSIPVFSNLSMKERGKLADACKTRWYNKGDYIIKEGQKGSEFFILTSGHATLHRRDPSGRNPIADPIIDRKYKGDHFGESALLNDNPCNASAIAADHGTEVLYIDKATFNRLLGPVRELLERREDETNELMMVEVDMFQNLSADCRTQLLSRLRSEAFADGDFVFHQGEPGDKMYIIKSGEVEVLADDWAGPAADRAPPLGQAGEPLPPLRKIDHLYRGRCFGERALVKREPRMAYIRALGALECFSITKAVFEELALAESAGATWSTRFEKEDTRDASQLKALKPLGSGAFGVAWLVQHSNQRTYALKILNKDAMKQRHWADVVIREKNILASLPTSSFVVTLYNSFQCPQNLYMLMEVAPGGELFQRVADNERLGLSTARFYVACIVLAIEHLHKHFICFRDLKPENLLVGGDGYLKLIDFGFARRLRAGEKAYTLCGTPYYLAPEMIQHKGHDLGVDWWGVGALLYEMIEGLPPFLGNNEMEVYEKVLALDYSFSDFFSSNASDLVHLFLCFDSDQRLGNLRNGAEDIKSHPWFASPSRPSILSNTLGSSHPALVPFDWDELAQGGMPPPYMPPTKEAGDAPRFDMKLPVEPVLKNIQSTRPADYNPEKDVWLDDWVM